MQPFHRYPAFGLGRGKHMGPSGLPFRLCGIISRNGRPGRSRRSVWSRRSGTASGTATAFSPPELCDALGPGSGAQPAVLRGNAKFRSDGGPANTRGRKVDCCRAAGGWLAPRFVRWGPARDGPRGSPRRICRTPTDRPKHRTQLSYRRCAWFVWRMVETRSPLPAPTNGTFLGKRASEVRGF